MRSSGLALVMLAGAVAALAPPSRAQEPPTASDAIAGVIHAALAPNGLGDWRYGWDAVSIRISSKLHWHLPGPDKPGASAIARRGWISTTRRQIGVEAHGEGETVTSLTFDYDMWPQFDSDSGPESLEAALATLGVAITEITRKPSPDFFHADEPVIVYRLSASGRDDGTLTRTTQCTSPQSAASQRCSTSYVLELGGR